MPRLKKEKEGNKEGKNHTAEQVAIEEIHRIKGKIRKSTINDTSVFIVYNIAVNENQKILSKIHRMIVPEPSTLTKTSL